MSKGREFSTLGTTTPPTPERIAEVEKDTEEAFRARRQLVKLLVQSITVGKKHEDGGIEVRRTYRFGPPSLPPAEADPGEVSVAGFRNGREFSTPATTAPTLTVVAVK